MKYLCSGGFIECHQLHNNVVVVDDQVGIIKYRFDYRKSLFLRYSLWAINMMKRRDKFRKER